MRLVKRLCQFFFLILRLVMVSESAIPTNPRHNCFTATATILLYNIIIGATSSNLSRESQLVSCLLLECFPRNYIQFYFVDFIASSLQ